MNEIEQLEGVVSDSEVYSLRCASDTKHFGEIQAIIVMLTAICRILIYIAKKMK